MKMDFQKFSFLLLNADTLTSKEEKQQEKKLYEILNAVLSAKNMQDLEEISDEDLSSVENNINTLCGEKGENELKKEMIILSLDKAPVSITDRIL